VGPPRLTVFARWRGARATWILAALACTAPTPALAQDRTTTALDWRVCDNGFECATATVPRDYDRPRGQTLSLALIRRPATNPSARIGSLFVNPGGPGGSGVDFVRGTANGGLAALNRFFDLVGFDPRGVGASRPAVSCLTADEARAQFDGPLPRLEAIGVPAAIGWASAWVNRCVARNEGILPYLSTGNAARDLDVLRAAVHDPKLTYLGFSYGTLLGATYASLYPDRVRALALDGAIDPDVWINRPLESTREQVAGSERALQRFFAACGRGTWCGFGGGDPEEAFDELRASLDLHPAPPGPPFAARPPATGDTLLVAAASALDSKPAWATLASALRQAEQGNGTNLRGLADQFWGIRSDGSYTGGWDVNLAISALDQRYPPAIGAYIRTAHHSEAMFPNFGWASGSFDLPWGLYPVRPRGAFRGPFTLPAWAPTALVIGTTYDPATPYVWSKRLTAQLGNARLLTMIGDGHTAFGNFSPCIKDAVERYLETVALPPAGTVCRQQLPLG
jgi:pimeloyl-ACP methyl ester carboxylesterase